MAEEKKLFKVTIDNITVEVEPGTSILQAARKIGGDVAPPAMCYYSTLKGSGGKCRTCLVEVAAGSTADPRPMPKLVASCRTNVMDGMVVKNITSERVQDARKGVDAEVGHSDPVSPTSAQKQIPEDREQHSPKQVTDGTDRFVESR